MLTALLSAAACRQEMYDQAKYKPLGESRFFGQPNARSRGTVAAAGCGAIRSSTRARHDLVALPCP
jgi:hypothetical protein